MGRRNFQPVGGRYGEIYKKENEEKKKKAQDDARRKKDEDDLREQVRTSYTRPLSWTVDNTIHAVL